MSFTQERVYPRQKSLKHPLPLDSVEMTFYCLTGCNNIEKGRGTNTARECSKCFKVFVEDIVVIFALNLLSTLKKVKDLKTGQDITK